MQFLYLTSFFVFSCCVAALLVRTRAFLSLYLGEPITSLLLRYVGQAIRIPEHLTIRGGPFDVAELSSRWLRVAASQMWNAASVHTRSSSSATNRSNVFIGGDTWLRVKRDLYNVAIRSLRQRLSTMPLWSGERNNVPRPRTLCLTTGFFAASTLIPVSNILNC